MAVQLFSNFGIFMIFVNSSWLTVMRFLEKIVTMHDSMEGDRYGNFSKILNNIDRSEIIDYDMLSSIIAGMHYAASVPYLPIFIYSFLYEITYENAKVGITARKQNPMTIFQILKFSAF